MPAAIRLIMQDKQHRQVFFVYPADFKNQITSRYLIKLARSNGFAAPQGNTRLESLDNTYYQAFYNQILLFQVIIDYEFNNDL